MMEKRVLSGRYQLLNEIGEGGMSTIFRAEDLKTGKEVAIKILKEECLQDKDMVKSFVTEAKSAIKLDHPNLVRVFEINQDGDTYYIVREYVEGKTLKEMIEEGGALPINHALAYAMDICKAMEYVHKRHIVHRDIKPDNIIVDGKNIARLMDFGIAQVMREPFLKKSSTDEDVVGSVHYIAPEQAKGERTDEKSDVYSLGATIYEMLTGRVPFTADTPNAIARKHICALVTPPMDLNPQVSHALNAIVLKALAKNPKNRYRSMTELYHDLCRAVTEPEGTFADTIDYSIEVESEHRDAGEILKKIRLIVIGVLAILVALFIGSKIFTGWVPSTQVKVPEVCGKYVDEAIEMITKTGLTYKIIREPNSELSGTVLSVSPEEGEMVLAQTEIVLTVSSGPATATVPNLIGSTLTDAQRLLQEEGLTCGKVQYLPQSQTPTGTVIQQTPENPTQLALGASVDLVIDGYDPSNIAMVPNVLDMGWNDAVRAFREEGFLHVAIQEDSSALTGTVANQSVQQGTNALRDQLVILTVGQYRSPSYRHTETVEISPESDQCVVTITMVEDEAEIIAYQKQHSAKSQSVRVTFGALSAGEKTINIFYDGVLAQTLTINIQ